MGSSSYGNKELYVPEGDAPVFINVDSRVVEQHELWSKDKLDNYGNVNQDTLNSILYSLGFDIKEGFNHYTGTIRDVSDKTKGFETKVYCGRMRKQYIHASIYKDVDVLTLPLTTKEINSDKYNLIALNEFGTEFFTEVPGQKKTTGRSGPYKRSAKMIEKQKKKDRELMNQWEKDNEDRRKNNGSRVR